VPFRDVFDPLDPHPAAQRELRAWLELQRVLALAPRAALRLLSPHGDPRRALRAAGRAPVAPQALDAFVEALRRCGAVALAWGSPRYPARLARLEDAPPLLHVRGDPAALSHPAVAVVGARAATRYGLGVARDVAAALARAGIAVISGLANGIDAAAHTAALEAGGLTLAVQGCGIDRVYPRGHRALADRIAASGAVVTEFAPGTPPLAPHFPQRNRIVSALARAVVVVEARPRSGSLVTARHALDQGIDVLAVPGPITAPTSAGTNRLLAQGASALAEIEDVFVPLGLAPPARPAEPAPADPLGLLAILRAEPASADALARRLGADPGALSLALLELELAGAIAEDRDGRIRATSRASLCSPPRRSGGTS
jgi:DNA processing protein